MLKKRVAVIDIGTLKTKFVIAEYDKKYNKSILFKDKKLTVIGRNLDKNDNLIMDQSLLTQLEALNDFMKRIKEFKVDAYRVVGTEALRIAKNSAKVISSINDVVKSELQILSHDEEAKLYFNAVAKEIPGKLAVTDIGGGSVQLIIGEGDNIDELHLMKTGTYFMQHAFSDTHFPTEQEQEKAWKYIRNEVKKLKLKKNPNIKFVYGSTNIIDFFKETGVVVSLNGSSTSHPYTAKIKSLLDLYNKIVKFSYEDRMQFFPSEPYYMWAADKAIMNVVSICGALDVDEVIPSNVNISDGLLLSLVR